MYGYLLRAKQILILVTLCKLASEKPNMSSHCALIVSHIEVILYSSFYKYRPDQGFIEITIKDLENVLHLEISRLWSLNLIELSSKSSAEFDYKKNVMTKRGKALKEHDLVKRQVDRNGSKSEKYHSWEVVEIQLHERLLHKDVSTGGQYYVYGREYSYRGLKKFQLVSKDIEDSSNPLYKFSNKEQGITIQVRADRFPAVYPENQHGFKTIVLQCIERNDQGVYERQLIEFEKAEKERFVMDVGQTNIVFATGKPTKLNNHTKITLEVGAFIGSLMCDMMIISRTNLSSRQFV